MRHRKHALLVLAMLLVCGCAVRSRYIEERGVLDKGLYYYEQDSGGKNRAISSEEVDLDGREPARVPHPALVDIDSMIHILVSKEHFFSGKNVGILAGRSEELLKRKKLIHRALIGLEKVVHARQKAVDAYDDDDLDKFISAKRDFGRAEIELNDRLDELWPDGTPEYDILDEAYDPPTFARLQEFLRGKISAIESEDRIIEDEVNSRIISLRLEAFLSSSKKDPIAIHLKGYDFIKQGEFQRRDRLGLDLSSDEKLQLDAQVKDTQKIVDTAERVRKGEISLQNALWETIPLVSPRLGQVMPKIESVLQKFNKESLMERLNTTEVLLKKFAEEVERQAEIVTDSFKKDLDKMPEKFRSSIEEKSRTFVNGLSLFKDAKDLRNRWSSITFANQAALITDSVGLFGRLEKMISEFPELATDVEGNLKWLLEEEIKSIELDIKNTLLRIPMSKEVKELRLHLEEFFQDLYSIVEITNEILAVFGVLEVSSIALGTQAPDSLKVPLDEVKDTFLDLNYTPRLIGDMITVRAILYKRNKEMDKTTASFHVKRFGWFAELSPAVVLVKPDKLEGGDDNYRFAPTLSWMHRYQPRPENSGLYAAILRGLQPAVGIHSIFTNFDSGGSAEALQVGLGITISFWENRLQFGAGYNLMADSNEEGRYYYFVGTDLIGLLQTVGVGK